jgi:hypothetical protein
MVWSWHELQVLRNRDDNPSPEMAFLVDASCQAGIRRHIQGNRWPASAVLGLGEGMAW